MLVEISILIAACLVGLLAIGLVLSRLYQRASKEVAFVRTGLGGQKVVMDGGALVLPIFHGTIPVNMNTLKLEVHRGGNASLITQDRLRVDIVAAFFVRVMPNAEAIANAAQTLGQRTLDPMALKELVEDKFVDSLRATAATMTMQQLQDARQDFVQGVQNAVSEDLLKNGLELESVSLTSLDQTGKEFFNPNNAFDAEGLTRLTQETERRRKERNEIEQDTQMAVRQKNLAAEQQKLEIDRQQEFLRLEQQQAIARQQAEQAANVAKTRAEQAALIAATEAEKNREAQQAKITSQQQIDQSRIAAERQVKEAEVERDRLIKQKEIDAQQQVEVARINQQKVMQIAEQDKAVSIARKSEEQSQAEAQANKARAEAVTAEEAVKTARETAVAERDKAIALVEASREAEQQAIGVKIAASAQKQAAEDQAEAVKTKAEADRVAYEVEAMGKRQINEAINTLSAEQIAMQVRLALIQALPGIIAKSVEPMQRIDGIKIIQVDGLGRVAGGGEGGNPGGGGNLAEQAVSAALSYRAQQPLVDALLNDLGMKGGSLAGLAQGVVDADAAGKDGKTLHPRGP
ncbi:flotillin family protein [Methylomagnum ishizawai]|uniref:flotillin family protein n=1 Tax=Methylomagnum ishizawai TaxID=1760988 RepID=UPI001C31FE70|nr:flotillin family protein [Methylomagnum ishizawai]BBL76145.1 flotillin [Methylomagnum ishizawai]